jgi:hypothetical protein
MTNDKQQTTRGRASQPRFNDMYVFTSVCYPEEYHMCNSRICLYFLAKSAVDSGKVFEQTEESVMFVKTSVESIGLFHSFFSYVLCCSCYQGEQKEEIKGGSRGLAFQYIPTALTDTKREPVERRMGV